MDESSEIFRELSIFFGEGAKIEMLRSDLEKFLGHRRLYRVIRLQADSYRNCVYQLVDDHPEAMEALGMLRYYRVPAGRVPWQEIETAEIAMGEELTMNAYGWAPDAWTAFEKSEANAEPVDESKCCEMVAILAFDFGE